MLLAVPNQGGTNERPRPLKNQSLSLRRGLVGQALGLSDAEPRFDLGDGDYFAETLPISGEDWLGDPALVALRRQILGEWLEVLPLLGAELRDSSVIVTFPMIKLFDLDSKVQVLANLNHGAPAGATKDDDVNRIGGGLGERGVTWANRRHGEQSDDKRGERDNGQYAAYQRPVKLNAGHGAVGAGARVETPPGGGSHHERRGYRYEYARPPAQSAKGNTTFPHYWETCGIWRDSTRHTQHSWR